MKGELGGTDKEKELQCQLIAAGVKLLVPPPTIDELLAALDKVEDLLSIVDQGPSCLIQDGLLPSMKALISDSLLKHPNMEVKISVMSCICEVLRITAPHQPYEDDRMKEVFQLTLAAFEKLSLFSGRCYRKALHILDSVAKVRCCVILLDVGCDDLVTEMFELLLRTIKFDHPDTVFSNMEEIMTRVIDESEEISYGLLEPLLASVKKENQITSPVSSSLGERVLMNCSAKVKAYLMEAVKSMRLDINDYADIVASLCRDMPACDNVVMVETETNASHLVEVEVQLCKSLLDDATAQERNNNGNKSEDQHSSRISHCHEQTEQLKSMDKIPVNPEALGSGEELQATADVRVVPSRRGRKPKSLIKSNKGYEHSKMIGDQSSLEIPCKRENHGKVNSSLNNSSPEKSPLHAEQEKENKPSSSSPRTSQLNSSHPTISLDQSDGVKSSQRKDTRKKKESMVNQDVNLDMLDAKGVLLEEQLKKKSLQGSDADLIIDSYKTKDADENPGRYSRRKKSAVKNNTQTTSGIKNVVVRKEKDIQSDSEGESLLLLKMKARKRRMKAKKAGRSEGFKKARIRKEYGEELVGSRIKVWWPLDHVFYEGVIDSFDPSRKKHKVLYIDGDQETLYLKKERWFLLEDTTSDQDEECNLPSSDAAVKSPKKKPNTENEYMIEQCDSVASSGRRSQTRGRKRGRKPSEKSDVETIRIIMEIDTLAKDDEETADKEETPKTSSRECE